MQAGCSLPLYKKNISSCNVFFLISSASFIDCFTIHNAFVNHILFVADRPKLAKCSFCSVPKLIPLNKARLSQQTLPDDCRGNCPGRRCRSDVNIYGSIIKLTGSYMACIKSAISSEDIRQWYSLDSSQVKRLNYGEANSCSLNVPGAAASIDAGAYLAYNLNIYVNEC